MKRMGKVSFLLFPVLPLHLESAFPEKNSNRRIAGTIDLLIQGPNRVHPNPRAGKELLPFSGRAGHQHQGSPV